MISEGNYNKVGLDDWVDAFYDIYRSKDRKRGVFEMWLCLVQDASLVAEFLRRDELGRACNQLAHVVCWLFCLNAKLRDNSAENKLDSNFLTDKRFSDVVFHKYPTVCWKCGSDPCQCPLHRIQIEKEEDKKVADEILRGFREDKDHLLPHTLDAWIRMFERIYGNVQYSLTIDQIGFHFLEEVGEVSREIVRISTTCQRTPKEDQSLPKFKTELKVLKDGLDTETADVFSWITSLIIKLKFFSEVISKYQDLYYNRSSEEGRGIELSKILWTEYHSPEGDGLMCPRCKQSVCIESCSG